MTIRHRCARPGWCAALLVAGLLARPTAASAQTVTAERTFTVGAAPTLDVETERGKIDVRAGEAGTVVVVIRVTVRTGFGVPVDAPAIAASVADRPPVMQDGQTVRLRPPAGDREKSAVTIAYEVRVPPATSVATVSDSGATKVSAIDGAVRVRTGSGAIDLSDLGSTVQIDTGSGDVDIRDAAGAVTVTTASSRITASELASSFHARTGSGSVRAEFTGKADVDVETESSAVRLSGLGGGARVTTGSGEVQLDGAPARPWHVTTGSSRITVDLRSGRPFTLDAESGSGSVTTEGMMVEGTLEKRHVKGAVHGGGPTITLESRSGSIRVRTGGT